MPYAYRSSEQTREAVLKVLTESDRPLTRKEISDAIDRVKGKQIVKVIEECVAQGLIQRTVVKLYNHLDAYAYYIAEGQGARK
jgi:predicted Zn-ribbon and HTH transcriptional regulator